MPSDTALKATPCGDSKPNVGCKRPRPDTTASPQGYFSSPTKPMIPQYQPPSSPPRVPAGIGAAKAKSISQNASSLSNAKVSPSSSLPSGAKAKVVDEPAPVKFLQTLFQQSNEGKVLLKRPLQHTFARPDKEALEAYNLNAVQAIRDRNVEKLRSMIAEGKSLNACNRFGESLMHMACRRGDEVVVRLLILEGNVSLEARDDFGRTPLHDACWTSKPNFAVLDLLLKASPPDLLLAEDVRGHTPFHYARKEHWDAWVDFLKLRSDQLLLKLSAEPLSVVG